MTTDNAPDKNDDDFDWESHPIAEQVLALLNEAEDLSDQAADEEDEAKSAALEALASAKQEEADQMIRDADQEDGLGGKLEDSYHEWGVLGAQYAMEEGVRKFGADFGLSKPVDEATDEALTEKENANCLKGS